ncbi:MAG: L-histidine N(alpha)-methyltransferase [Betaproteobacteria bacterium]
MPVAANLRWINERATRDGVTLFNRLDLDLPDERAALLEGLLATPARISPKYFYDELGCALFEAICALPEYYPTRTERAMLIAHRDEIAQVAGRRKQFVDLGAGDCAKALLLLPALEPRRYVAVDIAAAAIAPALARMAPAFPGTLFVGVVTDFSQRLDLDGGVDAGPATYFFPGSSIGNFAPTRAREFLASVRSRCATGSGLLIGVDTTKDHARLVAAYDDAVGVTAAFNRNILRHVNAVAGCDFDPAAFEHVALYDDVHERIEMHLQARTLQHVRIGDAVRQFAAGERIHTESSHKYAPAQFTRLLQDAGFAEVTLWQDARGDFAVYYAR